MLDLFDAHWKEKELREDGDVQAVCHIVYTAESRFCVVVVAINSECDLTTNLDLVNLASNDDAYTVL